MKRRTNAVFTVEAVIVVPIVSAVIIALIYVVLYQHDISVFEAKVNEITRLTKCYVQTGTDPETGSICYENKLPDSTLKLFTGLSDAQKMKLTEYVREECQSSFVIGDFEVAAEGGLLSENISIKLEFPELPLIFRVFTGMTQFREKDVSRIGREEKLRIYNTATESLSHIKGVNEIIHRLESMFSR